MLSIWTGSFVYSPAAVVIPAWEKDYWMRNVFRGSYLELAKNDGNCLAHINGVQDWARSRGIGGLSNRAGLAR